MFFRSFEPIVSNQWFLIDVEWTNVRIVQQNVQPWCCSRRSTGVGRLLVECQCFTHLHTIYPFQQANVPKRNVDEAEKQMTITINVTEPCLVS